MKLADHVEQIRKLIDQSYRNRLGRMGISATNIQPIDVVPTEQRADRERLEIILTTLIQETGTEKDAYEKLVDELTFTLFNRLAALKVMEAHILHPEIVTRRSQHGDRSFAHLAWLEQHPEQRIEELEGLVRFLEDQFLELSEDIPLFSLNHPYHLMPTAIELNKIILVFNQVELDPSVESDIWKSDDVLGWLYESYNNFKKANHKASGDKTEFDKVSIQSQVYTPRWVVKFLVDNSLGKLYLEMYPDSTIKDKYKIANAPTVRIREPKPLTEIKLIDPAPGSGNFLLYAFDLFYDLYHDQINHYGAEYDITQIPELIIQHNLHGIDLDDRAIQLAQLGLYIKAKRYKNNIKIEHFNIVSSDFYLPSFEEVKELFENGTKLSPDIEKVIRSLWSDLQHAYQFGSLVQLEEKFNTSILELTKNSDKYALFSEQSQIDIDQFKETFFANLQKALKHHSQKKGLNFLNAKTSDAITYLQILTQKYDVAVANPPYTDSAAFGPKLKDFIDANYKKPFKFNSNLYASFIKRCHELINEDGKMALIHPLTFMYLITFEDVRKYIINKLHINIFIEFGMGGLFPQNIFVDPAFYVLESKKHIVSNSVFISLDQYSNTYNQTRKKEFLLEAVDDYKKRIKNIHLFTLNQSKLILIESWPLIYWISDGFREKFKGKTLDALTFIRQGGATGNNLRMLRFLWEVDKDSISIEKGDNKKWVVFQKGGDYCKWFGNNWTIVGYNDSNMYDFLKENGNSMPSEEHYFKEGITYTDPSSKGPSFRYMPSNQIISGAGPGIYPNQFKNCLYLLGFLNSTLTKYIIGCLNSTVHTTQGDLKRIPFVLPTLEYERIISVLSLQNIDIKKHLCSYHIIESRFKNTPLTAYPNNALSDRILSHLYFENSQLTQILLNEAIIDKFIFEIYELSLEDREQVETKLGKPVGELPIISEAREAYLSEIKIENDTVKNFIQNLPTITFDELQIQTIRTDFASLYQANKDLEEFCIKHQLNPINAWYWFRESKILPPARAQEITLEFLADDFRTILMEDEDGIVPLQGLPGEPRLLDRLEQYCHQQGFTSAQFMQLDGLLGRPISEYMESHFFDDLENLLNLFRNLPKTPFIWHLSSGSNQGFEVYCIIYKWNRDSLFKLKSNYLSKRVESLQYRQIQLADSQTAQAQAEKELIRLQLQEIEEFTKKIDELIAEGYDPKLDDGVGKNIAPLQKKGLLRCDVLNPKQLDKYLHADW